MSTPTTEQGVDPVPAALDRTRVPVHVACVMDGNGRWASARGLPRTEGHTMGETALFDVVNCKTVLCAAGLVQSAVTVAPVP